MRTLRAAYPLRRAIPRDGWFDFCCDEAHAGQRVPACPSCGAAVDGETVTFDPGTGAVVCGHCDAHGRATYTVAPPRRPGGRVVGEPPIVDGPPPDRRVVGDEDAEAVVREYLQALPPGARQRRRSPKVTAAEFAAARVLLAQGGVEHAGWCARRLAAGAGAGAFFPPTPQRASPRRRSAAGQGPALTVTAGGPACRRRARGG